MANSAHSLPGGTQHGSPFGRTVFGRTVSHLITSALLCFGLTVSVSAHAKEKVIRLGSAISLSGKTAISAGYVKKGYDLAVERINAQGGVHIGNDAYKLEIIYRNDSSDPAMTRALARKLIEDDDVNFLIGGHSTGLTLPVSEVAEAYKVPVVQGGGASLSIYAMGRKYTFGVISTGNKYLAGAVDLAAEQAISTGRNPKDIKVALAFIDDSFTQDIRFGVLQAIKRWGMSVVVEKKLPSPLTDMSTFLEQVRETKPDLVIVSGRLQAAKLLAKQMAQMKVDAPMVALSHCDTAKIEAQGPNANYLLCTAQWNAYVPYDDHWLGSAVNFMVEYELKYNSVPPYQAAAGGAVILTLVDAIERAGSLNREKVREALSQTNLNTFFGPIRFDDTGKNTAKNMVIQQLQGNRYQVVWPPEAAMGKLIFPIPKWESR